MKKKYGWMLLAGLVGASQAWAAESPTTLKAAVEQAIMQNPEVRFRYHNLQTSNEERRAAQGNWLPRVDLEAASGRQRSESPITRSHSYANDTASIQLRQMLFDGFATSSEVRRLGHARQARYYELLSASDDVALEAARAYLDVLRYRELVELARQNYATHSEIHGQLAQRVGAGVGRKVDLEQAAGRLALAESNWLTEVSNLHDVSARYQRLVGEPPAASLTEPPTLDGQLPAREGFLADTIRHSPAFLAAVSAIRANRADVDVRKAARLPSVELRAVQSYEKNRDGLRGEYKDGSVQLVLNYNLFRGGADSARIRQYSEQVNAAQDLRDKACRDIRQLAQIAWNDNNRIREQIRLLSQHELSTAKARDAYRQQFDIGQRSLLDLLDTENELFEARRALASAERDLELAKVRVLASSSRLLSALQLRPLVDAVDEEQGGVADDDGLMNCSTELPPAPVLDKQSLPVRDPLAAAALAPKHVEVPQAEPVKPKLDGDRAVLVDLVSRWAAAWNRKDFAGYLGFYADDFKPAKGLTRERWEALRKQRLEKSGSLKVTLEQVEVVKLEQDRAEVRLHQRYGSEDYADEVDKTLNFRKVGKDWRIVDETVTRGRTF